MPDTTQATKTGMSVAQARRFEYAIVGVSILALALIFQPFSLTLYSIGAGLIVFAGLAFNLVPLCVAGRPASSLLKGALIIGLIFVIVAVLALGSAMLYSIYLTN